MDCGESAGSSGKALQKKGVLRAASYVDALENRPKSKDCQASSRAARWQTSERLAHESNLKWNQLIIMFYYSRVD
jgi:hypothetical protein